MDADLITLAVLQALLGFTSESRWLRHAHAHLAGMFPYLPGQSGYNKRLRALTGAVHWLIGMLGRDTSLYSDDVWVVDSIPVECARSTETVRRSELAGWAEYGYCASHSRFFWGLRLHLVCTLHGLPVGFALTGAKADERVVLCDIQPRQPGPDRPPWPPPADHDRDKNYFDAAFEAALPEGGIKLLRPARKGETARPSAQFFKPLRQMIESINDTLKGQLDLEHHGGRTKAGALVRVFQRILAMTAAIWSNDKIGATVKRSLTAYDHWPPELLI